MRRITAFLIAALCAACLFAQAAGEQSSSFVASTTWTASYADLAGVDDITVIAPSTLRHPPEYELVPSDIVTIQNADFFVSAGYERMMTTIQEGIPSEDRVDIHISTGNSLDNVITQAELIASYTGTTPRYEDYAALIEDARSQVAQLGLGELRVFCQGMLSSPAQDIGLNVTGTFSGELTPSQIEAVAAGEYDLVIDNYHNPSSAVLEDVAPCPIIMWRNFPTEEGRGALVDMVGQNIRSLVELYD